jgi:hypothetical protein
MNENHVIDSWVAELALGARNSRNGSARLTDAPRGASRTSAAVRPVGRRIATLLEAPRSNGASFRPCLPTA